MMHEETGYAWLRFLGRVHNVIGGVVLGLTLLLSGGVMLAGIVGVALLGTGDAFYRDSRVVIAGGIVLLLVGGFVAALILGLGQMFRALADLADNSRTLVVLVAGLRGDHATESAVGDPAGEDAAPGPTDP